MGLVFIWLQASDIPIEKNGKQRDSKQMIPVKKRKLLDRHIYLQTTALTKEWLSQVYLPMLGAVSEMCLLWLVYPVGNIIRYM